jgi:hypothetical protein
MASRTLLLPCAGKSSRYPGVRPKWMLTLPDGDLALQRAAASVPAGSYGRVVVAVRADHEEKYGCRALLKRAFGDSAEVVVLPRDTRGPADTVAQMIRRAAVSGALAVKDADSFFTPAALPNGSFVTLCDVRKMPRMSNVGGKSFAVLTDSGLVVQMVEKSLVSNFVSIGLYGFADAGQFLDHFEAVDREAPAGEIFVSHVLNRAALKGEPIRSLCVDSFIDVGTIDDWRRYVRAHGTIVCDLDGVVFENHSRFFPPYWDEDETPIAANVAVLREWQEAGAQLIFMTARPERLRARVQASLAAIGLKAHALVMDCLHGRRFLVNDHAASNPYPAAVAINLPRNAPSLPEHLTEWR